MAAVGSVAVMKPLGQKRLKWCSCCSDGPKPPTRARERATIQDEIDEGEDFQPGFEECDDTCEYCNGHLVGDEEITR